MKRRPLLWFYLLSYAFVFALVPTLLLTDWFDRLEAGVARSGLEPTSTYLFAGRLAWAAPEAIPAIVVSVLQPLAPTLAAVLVAWVAFRVVGLRKLAASLKPWRQIRWQQGLGWWACAIAVMLGLSLATAALNATLLPEEQFTWGIQPLTAAVWVALLAAMFLDAGGVGEEIGWHGFAYPILQERHGPLIGTLILGMGWSLWHVPVKVDLAFTYGWEVFAGMIALFMIRLTLFAVIMSFFYNKLGGSALVAIMMHGLHNDSVRLQGTIDDAAYDVHWVAVEAALILPILFVVVLIVWGTGGRLGLPSGEAVVTRESWAARGRAMRLVQAWRRPAPAPTALA